ncbi:prepilin-type N-terminal cleavage/methylation domain-containing protein [Bacillus sp. ISL-51]|uniref:competence type IV pilus minor pilin ComGD n=1 Tax=unclassified Bacillus (in: firmicutes) TaxID=185979 RepID=UPI001BE4FFF8|nr:MULTISPECIES: competence type IV pilus minor pilin ComGD [unclassified Bacillus (in: firmicutes)]MBT2574439.1 prepilin-type N-terminal cleavage/methylation domain-containing protein [Bacillus sp. ISL-51]MBT2633256.1 prepilin-type N-terminal cleavage/methylation domain-containing protein [Bacillus sp. ISL-26]
MRSNRLTEGGFTLLESLVVLSLASVLLTVFFTAFPPVYTHIAVRQKADQLQKDIQLAQETAIAEHKRTSITFLPKEHKYKLSIGGSIVERSFEKIEIALSTLPMQLEFNEKGHPNSGGKIDVKTVGVTYEITVYLGSGNVYAERK